MVSEEQWTIYRFRSLRFCLDINQNNLRLDFIWFIISFFISDCCGMSFWVVNVLMAHIRPPFQCLIAQSWSSQCCLPDWMIRHFLPLLIAAIGLFIRVYRMIHRKKASLCTSVLNLSSWPTFGEFWFQFWTASENRLILLTVHFSESALTAWSDIAVWDATMWGLI